MKRIFAVLVIAGAILVIVTSVIGYRFYRSNLRGMSDSGTREHLHILSDAAKRRDFAALAAEYDNNKRLWQDLESKNQMIAEADAMLMSEAYEKAGRQKDAALQYYKLAQIAQQKGNQGGTTYYISKAAGLDPQNADIETFRRSVGAAIQKPHETSVDKSIANGSGIIRLSLALNGGMAVDEVLCNSDTLVKTLQTKLTANPNAQVIIYVDNGVPYKSLESVMDKARQAGSKHTSMNSVQSKK